jgi:hypothetical protein
LVSLTLDILRANCPTCDNVISNPTRRLGGLVFRSKGANDFTGTQMAGVGDPRLYLIMNSIGSGFSNGNDNSTTKNSRVYPYLVTAAEGEQTGNVILIDNDEAGTALFRHGQYKP